MKNYEKAKISFEKQQLKAANKLINKCLEDASTKNNANVLFLKAKIMYEISRDKKISESFPNAFKDAVKFTEKALEKTPTESAKVAFKNQNRDFLKTLLKANTKDALDAYYGKKYSKALPLFKRNIDISQDTQSIVLAGDCYWQMGQRTESLPYFKTSLEMIYNAVMDSSSKVYGYSKEPFRKLAEYYIVNNHLDTAYTIVKKGRDILPNDPILTDMTYKLMVHQLNKLLPSEDYLLAVENGLKDFPSDSFLNHKQNALYLFLFNGLAKANEQNKFDSLLIKFTQVKSEKAKDKNLKTILKFDIFAGLNQNTCIEKLYEYFANYNINEACFATFNSRWFPLDKSNSNIHPVNIRPENPQLAYILFTRYIELYPLQKQHKIARLDYTKKQNTLPQTYYNILPLILLNDACLKEQPKTLAFKDYAKSFRLRLIEETADSADFKLSRLTWHETYKKYPETTKILEPLWRKIIINDFKVNYFGSRIGIKGKNDPGVPEFIWNGALDSCKPGFMSASITQLVQNRINYFRRNAGLTEEIILSKQNNLYCEIAAMMCEANKSMSHEPNDGWRCFIPAGADVLKDALLIKEPNPSIAITAAMGHAHPTVGHRRWLLYPKSLYLGMGTSKNYSVIKAIDNSRELDTNKFKNQFIAWPPENLVPKMLVFKKWSFSIQQNLEGATVSMKDLNGNNIELIQEVNENGYGLNTIVWEPKINLSNITDQDIFTITIRLKNNKTFIYKTQLIDVNPLK
ncbi:MAG: CAP domain-containing protein [Bacteroidota bacterium]|nr:CAP domain-containing protein [Bacteroidota bacterium]